MASGEGETNAARAAEQPTKAAVALEVPQFVEAALGAVQREGQQRGVLDGMEDIALHGAIAPLQR